MQHTLIAVFDNRTDAQGAMDELLLSGFSKEGVRLTEDTTSVDESTDTASYGDEGFTASIKHFFTDLFGDSDEHSHKYSTAVSKGHHVLTVTAPDEPEVERAADIVERFGPVDIDEKTAEWGGVAMPPAQSMRMGEAGSMQRSEGSSLQFHEDRHLFAQGNLNDERPMGQTYMESMGSGPELTVPRFASVQRGSSRVFSPIGEARPALDDDTYYRNHWERTYGDTGKDYGAYASAYSFGQEMANMYHGRTWDDVESEVRGGWDTRNTLSGESTWEHFKDAIRHGWNRLTS